MTDEQVKSAISTAFDYAYLHEEWVTPFDEALEGLSAEDAARVPAGAVNGIWHIVLHVAVWNENIVERTRTREKARPVEGAWPALPEVCDEAAWEAAQERLRRSLKAMHDMMEELTLDELNAGPYGIADLLCRFVHVGYHIGQIVKQRELIDI